MIWGGTEGAVLDCWARVRGVEARSKARGKQSNLCKVTVITSFLCTLKTEKGQRKLQLGDPKTTRRERLPKAEDFQREPSQRGEVFDADQLPVGRMVSVSTISMTVR